MKIITPIAELAGVDILNECKRFDVPKEISSVRPIPFYNISMTNLAWLWDITDTWAYMIAVAEVFFYPALPWWCRRLFPDSEKWAKRWVLNAPAIDYYRFTYEVTEQAKQAAEQFAKMQIALTDEERQAGYGGHDPEAVQKMIDAFARRQRISSLEVAGSYPWSHYRFVFKADIDEQNKQRKYQEILAKKQRKK